MSDLRDDVSSLLGAMAEEIPAGPADELSRYAARRVRRRRIGTVLVTVLSVTALAVGAVFAIPAIRGGRHQEVAAAGFTCDGQYHLRPRASFKGDRISLQGVVALSPNDVWAAGRTGVLRSGSGVLEHFDGTTWHLLPDALPAGTVLEDLAAVSTGDIWGVGWSGAGESSRGVIERYDGTAWRVVAGPELPPGSALLKVLVFSDSNVYAVGGSGVTASGRPIVEHFDGTEWTMSKIPASMGSLSMLAGSGPSDVWASGRAGNAHPLFLHFDGTGWSRVAAPAKALAVANLRIVAALSPTDAWAIGGGRDLVTDTIPRPLVAHWNGSRWAIVPSAQPSARGFLWTLVARTPSDIDALGRSISSDVPLIQHWNGQSWATAVASSLPGHLALSAATSLPDGKVFVVGRRGSEPNSSRTVVLERCG